MAETPKKAAKPKLAKVTEKPPTFEPLRADPLINKIHIFGYRNALEIKDTLMDDKVGRDRFAGDLEKYETGKEFDQQNVKKGKNTEKPPKRTYLKTVNKKDKLTGDVTEEIDKVAVTKYISINGNLKCLLSFTLSKFVTELWLYTQANKAAGRSVPNQLATDMADFIENVQQVAGSVCRFMFTLAGAKETQYVVDDSKGQPAGVGQEIKAQIGDVFDKIDSQVSFVVNSYLHFVRCMYLNFSVSLFDVHGTVDRKMIFANLRLLNLTQKENANHESNGVLANVFFDDLGTFMDQATVKKVDKDPLLEDDEPADKPVAPKKGKGKAKAKAKAKPAAADDLDDLDDGESLDPVDYADDVDALDE
jgi:hypothetical protein